LSKFALQTQLVPLLIGAKLNLLGKSTTLLQGSMGTVRWLDHHAKRLTKVKSTLRTQLTKYSTSTLPTSVTYSKGLVKTRGGASLRALMDQTEELRLMLARYRPKLADTIAVEVADIMVGLYKLNAVDPWFERAWLVSTLHPDLVSKFAFKINLCHYIMGYQHAEY
jgi:hypothetical protein